MAFLGETFDTASLPQSEASFDPLPAGWYQAKITKAEVKNTKAGTGNYIAVRYDILGPTHQGRVVFGNLNIKNPNSEAERIGREQLGELMRAVGLARVQDSDELIGGELSIKLKVRLSEQYGDSNDVAGYRAISGTSAPKPPTGAVTPAAPAGGKPPPPWAKK